MAAQQRNVGTRLRRAQKGRIETLALEDVGGRLVASTRLS
jgi:hypothetical protein